MDQCTKIFMYDCICSQILKSMENEKNKGVKPVHLK